LVFVQPCHSSKLIMANDIRELEHILDLMEQRISAIFHTEFLDILPEEPKPEHKPQPKNTK